MALFHFETVSHLRFPFPRITYLVIFSEALGKETAEVVARALESLGFSVWLSRDQKDVDKAGN